MKLLIFILVTLMGWKASAACPKNRVELKVPGSYLAEFLSPGKVESLHAFPFPADFCIENGMFVDFVDPYGEVAGTMTVSEVWKGLYSENTVEMIPAKEAPPRILRSQFQKRKMEDVRSIRGLLALSFKKNEDSLKDLQVAKGSFQKKAGYVLNWNIFTFPRNVEQYPVVQYDGLVDLLAKRADVFVALNKGDSLKANRWRIPRTQMAPPGPTSGRAILYNWTQLINAWEQYEKKFQKVDKTKGAVAYSSPENLSLAVNAMDWLSLIGYHDVRWFRDGVVEWNTPQKAKQQISYKFKNEIQAPGVLNLLHQRSTIVLDLRSSELYRLKRIPSAVNATLVYENRIFISKDLTSLLRGKSDVIIYLDGDVVGPLMDAESIVLREAAKVPGLKVHVYKAGFSDWMAHFTWMPERGFTVE